MIMGELNGNRRSRIGKKLRMWPTMTIITKKKHFTWGIKGLIVIQSNLDITWKDKPYAKLRNQRTLARSVNHHRTRVSLSVNQIS